MKPTIANDWYSRYVKTTEEVMRDKDGGIKVIGPCTSDGSVTVWHFGEDEKMAQHFAEGLCRDVQNTVLVVRMIGKWTPVLPVHYVDAAKQEKQP